jgi:Methylene-tetrahydrofolate reductase C terminal
MNALERAVVAIERPIKEAVWDCRMCGQCILHSTGLTCPMRCPKNLRNGPCGGVRPDGGCEVFPDRPCVWVKAVEGSRRLPLWRDHLEHLNPPLDWRLQGSSSWINLVTGRDRRRPGGWGAEAADANPA